VNTPETIIDATGIWKRYDAGEGGVAYRARGSARYE